jgi:hypothetical protein
MGGARFVGLEHELGSIARGKLADFMVLERNPLEKIENTTTLWYVVKGGRVYDAATLEQLWPERRPYGPMPWFVPDAMRTDDRPLDYWDRPPP